MGILEIQALRLHNEIDYCRVLAETADLPTLNSSVSNGCNLVATYT